MTETLFISLWFICGLIGGGFLFAKLQCSFPEVSEENFRRDLGFAILFSVFGVAALFVGFFMSERGQHGCRLWRN